MPRERCDFDTGGSQLRRGRYTGGSACAGLEQPLLLRALINCVDDAIVCRTTQSITDARDIRRRPAW